MKERNISAVTKLFRFMSLFNITTFHLFGCEDKAVFAQVGWLSESVENYTELNVEDEVQDIKWVYQDLLYIDDALSLAEVIHLRGGIKSDNIIFSTEEIMLLAKKEKGWNKDYVESVLADLLEVKVSMLDDGGECDFYFLHF